MHDLLDFVDTFVILAERVKGPYLDKRKNREYVVIFEDDGTRRTLSYPKYLMEKELGQKLDTNLTVDHWDSNRLNQDLSNLRVVPRSEHSADDVLRVKLVDLKCDWCQKQFQRSPRLLRDKAKKKCRGTFCSRSCRSKHNRAVQLGKAEPLPVQPFIESEYYKRKYLEAQFDIDSLFAFGEETYLYHETKRENLADIASEGLLPTSYGQSLVDPDTHEVLSPDMLEEEELKEIPPEDLIPRTYIHPRAPTNFYYGDILLRFPKTIAGRIKRDVDPFILKKIPPDFLEILVDGEWKKLNN